MLEENLPIYVAAVVADIAEVVQTDVEYTIRRVEMRGPQLHDVRVVVDDNYRLFEA